ncbi:PilZ domain-containing protein [Chitinivorax sp. B]|uniref:PilZ domain-containing protein n=1 Tax=Chitinivorax sp. B TaxID=2502235 RepID=UPI0010F72507|nr:PilZ domain-containing protein [Chitinivorax sp. B]
MRQFIRHPASVPIEITSCESSQLATGEALNISVGGLAFGSTRRAEKGEMVAVRIPGVRPVFESNAQVIWCNELPPGYELGVAFLDPEDAFRARMVEQVCQIEQYMLYVREHEHRELTAEQAAIEWIEKYAAHFPTSDSDTWH